MLDPWLAVLPCRVLCRVCCSVLCVALSALCCAVPLTWQHQAAEGHVRWQLCYLACKAGGAIPKPCCVAPSLLCVWHAFQCSCACFSGIGGGQQAAATSQSRAQQPTPSQSQSQQRGAVTAADLASVLRYMHRS